MVSPSSTGMGHRFVYIFGLLLSVEFGHQLDEDIVERGRNGSVLSTPTSSVDHRWCGVSSVVEGEADCLIVEPGQIGDRRCLTRPGYELTAGRVDESGIEQVAGEGPATQAIRCVEGEQPSEASTPTKLQ